MILTLFAFVLGGVVGSFLNVVIYRLPKKESIVAPPSHCPHCNHRLSALELIPIFSWIFQRGRCRHCGARISARYPLVEALTASLFALAARLQPDFPALLLVWVFMALLIALSFIDIDTYTLPDSLVYAGLALGWMASYLLKYPLAPQASVDSALMSAGLLALVAGYSALLVRRLKDGKREWPVGLHTMHLAGMVGAWSGPAAGLVAGFLNWALNARSKKVFALPDGLTLGLAALAPVAGYMVPGWLQSGLDSLRGLLVATGGLALAGGLYWAFRPEPEEDPNEVVVMGFGDIKLAGMLGAWLGFWPFLVGLMVAVLAGAVLGTAFRSRKVPFGPYLAIGGLVALFFGNRIVSWYLSYLGIG